MTQTQTTNPVDEYNGWANRATWNISLWIDNDENLYRAASNAVDKIRSRDTLAETVTPAWAKAFATVEFESCFGKPETPDGIRTNDPDIDWSQIADMIKEL